MSAETLRDLLDDRRARAAAPWLGAVVSGLALGLAFPKPDLHLLVWVSLVPLWAALAGRSPGTGWWLGLVTGLVYRTVTVYWVVDVMVLHGGLPWPVALLAGAALILALAAFVGAFGAFAAWLMPAGPGTTVVLAAAWVGLEYSTGWLVGGFPWALVGYAAGRSLTMLQVADLAGVFGLGFLAVFVNGAIASLVLWRRPALPTAIVAGLLTVGALGYGAYRLAGAPALAAQPTVGEEALAVVLVQGNVPQGVKWDPDEAQRILDDHLRLSRQRVGGSEADLVVWPEAAVPSLYGFAGDPQIRGAVGALVDETGVPVLAGSPHVEGSGETRGATNSAFLVTPEQSWQSRYDKVRLVPFGEYVPFRRWIPFIEPLVQAVAGFRAGDPDQELLEARRFGVPPFATAICYEIVFPWHVRRQVARGATFLVTITNDAWFGDSSAPYQHFAMARMRAVENRRWLVRAANTGISGVVDPWGRVVERLGLGRQGTVQATIASRDDPAPYTLRGDFFVAVCVLLVVTTAALRHRGEGPWAAEPA